MNSFLVRLSLAVFLSAPGAGLRAADYQGAGAALKQVEEMTRQEAVIWTPPDTPSAFRAALKDFQVKTASLAPEAAARGWLELFDRARKLASPETNSSNSLQIKQSLRAAFLALPPPETWPALAAAIRARPVPEKGAEASVAQNLRIIAAALLRQEDPAWEAADTLNDLLDPENSLLQTARRALRDALTAASASPQHELAAFMAELTATPPAPPDHSEGEAASQEHNDQPSLLNLPDLVLLAGPERAETLLRRAFTLPFSGVSSSLPDGGPTLTLARRVALEMAPGKLAFAPWELTENFDSAALYEALNKRAAAGASRFENVGEQLNARRYYVLGLLGHGRADEAAALATEGDAREDWVDESGAACAAVLEQFTSDGHAREAAAFLRQLLDKRPLVTLCSSYIAAATLAGETDAMLAFLPSLTKQPGLEADAIASLREAYGSALLAAGRVPEGVRVLRELLAEDNPGTDRSALALRLARIGSLLDDPELAGAGLDALLKERAADADSPGGLVRLDRNWNDLFLAAGRGPELEQVLINAWLAAKRGQLREARAKPEDRTQDESSDGSSNDPAGALCALAVFYDDARRPADALALFDRAEDWGEDDLAGLIANNHGNAYEDVVLPLARALRAAGRRDEALRAVNALLDAEPGSDSGYALLLELTGDVDRTLARLDELFARDPFEERPLIWKAQVLASQGKLPEAEACARRAIAINPSDAGAGRGDRLRACVVLSDILRQEKQPEEADRLASAVRAIRLSEAGDRFLEAGLPVGAVSLYQKALECSGDVFCLHAWLAVQLTALGHADEATAHYQRAYELMPGSLGRLEGEAPGSEKAFVGTTAQAIAEKVLLAQAAREPNQPQVRYLIGGLREQQGRHAEAAAACREAVRLDPDYLNAWQHLADVSPRAADRDAALLNQLRLDPRRRHTTPDLTKVTDLPALWRAVAAARKLQIAPPREAYPLAASRAARAKEATQHAADPENEAGKAEAKESAAPNSLPATPQQAILDNTVITGALQIISLDDSVQPEQVIVTP